MDPLSSDFPYKIEENVIGITQLNTIMLQSLLTGVYTVVYGATAYLYLSKRPQTVAHRAVLAAVTVLYVFSFFNLVVQWIGIDHNIITSGETQNSIFQASLTIPQWTRVGLGLISNISIVVADMLLVWRCYGMWGNSWKVITVVVALLVIESALSITDLVFLWMTPEINTAQGQARINYIAGATLLSSLCTTLYATILIGYKIYSSTRDISRSRNRYMRILTIVIETSAIYSIILIVVALCSVVPQLSDVTSPLIALETYATVAENVLGIVPTAMVLRLVLASHRANMSSHASLNQINDAASG
ncbi:hypothetical protein JR316_0011172 [Psilocybe cubensis]|uniref:Uncharacterized protein n=1 Tax=Psilocybe cubensis TaxID=181762 RepID=A0ACB8GNX2_PSICU|nr:hypothetical protein JR316_0011172 [Psilocybe cubensis]KAH9477253.1 hypothetical protein JR316_0011172 [Psilocybe cubensis]